MGPDIVKVVHDFFRNGKLLTEINNTIITLVPKVKSPTSLGDYRPIVCCTVLHKIITKLICERLKLVLPDIIFPSQSAFVVGRNIMNNVLLCQDLVKGYKKKQGQKGCLMKIDIRKAYDTVEWSL